jgi:hypothetical protein
MAIRIALFTLRFGYIVPDRHGKRSMGSMRTVIKHFSILGQREGMPQF